jgi:hypothetical protein
MEIVDNVWEHSESAHPALVCVEITHRRLAFAVADLGIGVLNSLRSNPKFARLDTSIEALSVALQPGASRVEGTHRGYGFSSVLRGLADLWGTLRLRSGEASLVLDGTRDERRRIRHFVPPLPGLQVIAVCGLDKPGQP